MGLAISGCWQFLEMLFPVKKGRYVKIAFHRFELVRVFFGWHLDKSLLSAFSAEIVMFLAAGEEEKTSVCTESTLLYVPY